MKVSNEVNKRRLRDQERAGKVVESEELRDLVESEGRKALMIANVLEAERKTLQKEIKAKKKWQEKAAILESSGREYIEKSKEEVAESEIEIAMLRSQNEELKNRIQALESRCREISLKDTTQLLDSNDEENDIIRSMESTADLLATTLPRAVTPEIEIDLPPIYASSKLQTD